MRFGGIIAALGLVSALSGCGQTLGAPEVFPLTAEEIQFNKAQIDTAETALRDLGYEFVIAGTSVRWDPTALRKTALHSDEERIRTLNWMHEALLVYLMRYGEDEGFYFQREDGAAVHRRLPADLVTLLWNQHQLVLQTMSKLTGEAS